LYQSEFTGIIEQDFLWLDSFPVAEKIQIKLEIIHCETAHVSAES